MQGRHADFWQVTEDALDYVLDALSVADDADNLAGGLIELGTDPFADEELLADGIVRAAERRALSWRREFAP